MFWFALNWAEPCRWAAVKSSEILVLRAAKMSPINYLSRSNLFLKRSNASLNAFSIITGKIWKVLKSFHRSGQKSTAGPKGQFPNSFLCVLIQIHKQEIFLRGITYNFLITPKDTSFLKPSRGKRDNFLFHFLRIQESRKFF